MDFSKVQENVFIKLFFHLVFFHENWLNAAEQSKVYIQPGGAGV